jgi:5'-3' exonuclease
MGVPGFFAWILKRFKHKIILNDLNIRPNALYIDANCLFHPECFKILGAYPNENNIEKLENLMIDAIIKYIEWITEQVNPSDLVYIAVDGVAPLAKINQQRKRRYKTIIESKIRNTIKDKYNIEYNSVWNNTNISPGTKFMETLHQSLKKHFDSKKTLKYIYSSYHTPAEGEHKILQHIKANPSHIKVIYGLDADLFFLSMSSQQNNIFLYREGFELDKQTEKAMLYASVDETKKAFDIEIRNLMGRKKYCYELNIDFTNDIVFICYFLGNDFLPHLMSIDIHKKGLDELINMYIYCVNIYKSSLITVKNSVHINEDFLLTFLQKLGDQEYNYFKHTLPYYQEQNSKRKCLKEDEYSKEIWKLENMKTIDVNDTVKLGEGLEDDWKFRYYETHFKVSEYQEELKYNLTEHYLKGIKWVTEYYFGVCPDWEWYYPYEHAPFISDMHKNIKKHNISINKITFDDCKPIDILTQLTCILPRQMCELLPKEYHYLVTSIDSPIIDMFPLTTELDILHKSQYYQCTPKLPRIDINRIKNAVKNIKLSEQDKLRT